MMRVEFPGAIYHRMSRGDRREVIFLDDVGRPDFLKTLAIAGRLRKETTLTVNDISIQLNLGTSKTAMTNVHRFTKAARADNTPLLFPSNSPAYGL